MKEPLEILQKYWGYSSFVGIQEKIISSILSKKDTLGIMPTGGGKSICYQVPAMLQSGICLVIEPLISLIKDQIDNLDKVGIRAVTINHLQSKDKNLSAMNQCLNHRAKFLFVSAERLQSSSFINNLVQLNINLIAIDEAHCISQWGHSFRPSYLRIGDLKDIFPNVPFLALTATATEYVKEDIKKVLRFKEYNSNILTTSFFRENIHLKFHETEDKIEKIAITAKHLKTAGIVYCNKRVDTVMIAHHLEEDYGLNAEAYHAQLTPYERNNVQNLWIKNEIQIIVATTAFGMGIDKADVGFVIHTSIPSSIERYYQEFGRAGRNKQKAFSVVLYNKDDLYSQKYITENIYPDKKIIKAVYNKVCSDAKIATGCGKGENFPIDFKELSVKLDLSETVVFNSLKILENEGWWRLSCEESPLSQVRILVDNKTLNDFLYDYEAYYYIIAYLLREYPAIHHEYVRINETYMAQQEHISETQVKKDLVFLMKNNIIEYVRKEKGDNITLLEDRTYFDNGLLSKEIYTIPKQSTIEKGKKMRELVLTKTCRWQYILNYFGEKSDKCFVCDNCKK
ncbi:MAG: RecQ family ATP-dependent DNA helicase [Bacteroidales bacterium]|nr:RecQ family ATP-dependent DNA helicase [Bacteroidales bacterium]